MDEEVLKLDRCLSYTQVENGVFARMAVLEWAMEGRGRCC
jgi:aspartate carbamoyltransferase catalytic subunit